MTTRKSKTSAPKASATKTTKKTTANKTATARKKPQAAVRTRATAKSTEKKAAPAPTRDEISARAYELFEESGYQHGRDEEHWLRAEQELIAEAAMRADAPAQVSSRP